MTTTPFTPAAKVRGTTFEMREWNHLLY
jgi:hypothetical protein